MGYNIKRLKALLKLGLIEPHVILAQSTFACALFDLGATEHDIVDVDVAASGVIGGRDGDA